MNSKLSFLFCFVFTDDHFYCCCWYKCIYKWFYVCDRFLQKNCTEQESVFMCRQSTVSHRQKPKEKMPILQISEMSQRWYETGRCVWRLCLLFSTTLHPVNVISTFYWRITPLTSDVHDISIQALSCILFMTVLIIIIIIMKSWSCLPSFMSVSLAWH